MDKKRSTKIIGAIVIIIAMIIVALLFLLFGSYRETRTSQETITSAVAALDCKSTQPLQNVFSYKSNDSATHELKITFDNERIDKINYIYTGRFTDASATENALAEMHAKYNTYMGTTEIYHEDLTPVFTVDGTEGRINLFIERKKFTAGTAKLVFLDDDEYAKMKKAGIEDVKKLYENKGFRCVSYNN